MDKPFKPRFSKCRIHFLKNNPLFGELGMWLQPVEDNTQPTTAVDKDGIFYYNKKWVDKMDDYPDLVAEIAHEIGHLFLKSNTRMPAGGIHSVWNKASDIRIDITLMKSGIQPSKVMKECTTPDLVAKYENMSDVEIYYDLLKDIPPDQQQAMKDAEAGKGTGQGKGKSCGGHTNDIRQCCSGTTAGSAIEKDKVSAEKWKQRAAAAASFAKSRGKLPGPLAEWFDELLEPKIHWTDYLRVKSSETLRTRWTWRIPGRRGEALGIRLPGKDPDAPTAVGAIDTSGSMSNEDILNCASEFSEIVRLTGGKARLLLFDHSVYFDKEIEDLGASKIQMERGGTDFEQVFKHLEDDPPKLLVFFTDLYAPYPKKHPGYPVVWAVTPDHSSNPVPFGEVVIVEKR